MKDYDQLFMLLNGSKEDVVLALGIIDAQGLDISDVFISGKDILEKYWYRSQSDTVLRKIGKEKRNDKIHFSVKINHDCYMLFPTIDMVLAKLLKTKFAEEQWWIM